MRQYVRMQMNDGATRHTQDSTSLPGSPVKICVTPPPRKPRISEEPILAPEHKAPSSDPDRIMARLSVQDPPVVERIRIDQGRADPGEEPVALRAHVSKQIVRTGRYTLPVTPHGNVQCLGQVRRSDHVVVHNERVPLLLSGIRGMRGSDRQPGVPPDTDVLLGRRSPDDPCPVA